MASKLQVDVKRGIPDDLDSRAADGFTRERVREIQRQRMLNAMLEVVADHGVVDATVAKVVACAGVSRRTFYEIFEDREDCFLAACEAAIERVRAHTEPPCRAAHGWRAAVRAALTALLELFEEEPCTARLLIVEMIAAGPHSRLRRAELVAGLVAALDASAGRAGRRGEPTPLATEGVIGGVLSVLHARIAGPMASQPSAGSLMELLNPLMAMVVLPYEGRAAAERELNGTIARRARSGVEREREDPLRELQMRLTYRTLRVLSAVAASPGSSNRVIAKGAGISDQGQISKLLARLQRLGLVENVLGESTRGEPNSWTLTDKGWRLHGAIDAHAAA